MRYCEEFAALLDPYIDNELSPEETARVREHLRTCDGCRAYVQAALLMRDAFPEAEDAVVPEGFAEGVMAAIRADAAPRRSVRGPGGSGHCCRWRPALPSWCWRSPLCPGPATPLCAMIRPRRRKASFRRAPLSPRLTAARRTARLMLRRRRRIPPQRMPRPLTMPLRPRHSLPPPASKRVRRRTLRRCQDHLAAGDVLF